MNIIKINGVAFKLPSEMERVHSVLNHIDMVKKGLKNFVKLWDLNDVEHRFSQTVLSSAIITYTLESL